MAPDPLSEPGSRRSRRDEWAVALRRSGRIVGVVAGGWWVLVLVAGVLIGDEAVEDDATLESVAVATLATLCVLGVVVSFLRTRIGARITIAAGCAFSLLALFTAGRNQILAMVVSGGPFVAGGLLLLAGSRPSSTA